LLQRSLQSLRQLGYPPLQFRPSRTSLPSFRPQHRPLRTSPQLLRRLTNPLSRVRPPQRSPPLLRLPRNPLFRVRLRQLLPILRKSLRRRRREPGALDLFLVC